MSGGDGYIEILIVDDSTYNLFILEELIKSLDLDFQITKALNGEEALDIIKKKATEERKSF